MFKKEKCIGEVHAKSSSRLHIQYVKRENGSKIYHWVDDKLVFCKYCTKKFKESKKKFTPGHYFSAEVFYEDKFK